MITSFTGKSSVAIDGMTINSTFGLPINLGDYRPLNAQKLRKMQIDFENVEYIIIDEISMVSCQTFAWIDARLKEIKESKCPFGGVNIIICGDWGQIPPVVGKPLYYNKYIEDDIGFVGKNL